MKDNRDEFESEAPSERNDTTPAGTPYRASAKRTLFGRSEVDDDQLDAPPPSAAKPAAAAPRVVVVPNFNAPAPVVLQNTIISWETDLAYIVRRGIAPLIRFLGAVSVKMGADDIRPLLVWSKEPELEKRYGTIVKRGAKTAEEFVANNAHLGATMLKHYLDTIKVPEVPGPGLQAPIGAGFSLDDLDANPAYLRARFQKPLVADLMQRIAEAQRNRDAVRAHTLRQELARLEALESVADRELEALFAPAWAFEVLGSAAFRHIANDTTLAAIDMAHSKVRRIAGCASFTIKELICSDQVSDQFAFMVAAEWLNSGDVSDVGSRSKKRGTGTRYFNINQLRLQLGRQLDTCAIWFEAVVARPNPLVAAFEEKLRGLLGPPPPEGAEAEQEERARRSDTLLAYGRMLPQRELVHTNRYY